LLRLVFGKFSKSRQKLAQNLHFEGEMGSKCEILFSGSPKGTSLHETSFDNIDCEIGAGAFLYGIASSQKILAESLCAGGAKTLYWIVMKFCLGVGVLDIITHVKFCGHRFGVLGTVGVKFPSFPSISIDFGCRP